MPFYEDSKRCPEILNYTLQNTKILLQIHYKLVSGSLCDKKANNTVPRTNAISNLNGEEIVGTFYEKVAREKP